MAHHVGALEVRKCDIVDTAQNLLNVGKTATTTHQVALAQVAGNHKLGVKAQARQEHLHLLGRGICASSSTTKASLSVRPRI